MLEKAKDMLQSQNKLLQFRSPAELFLIKLALAKTKTWYILVGSILFNPKPETTKICQVLFLLNCDQSQIDDFTE